MNVSSMPLLQGVTLCAALFVSAASAQAPVYDVQPQSNPEIEQRLLKVERILESRTEMQHEMQQQLDTLQGEVDELRGAIELHTNQLEKILERQRELYLEIDKRVDALKESSAQAVISPSTGSTTASTVRSSQTSAIPEDDAYEQAVNLIIKSKEYDKAIPALRKFIAGYPQSSYLPNAHYWLGQLLFNQQSWQEAQVEFATVTSKFKDSSKRPDALLKLGIIAQQMGDNAMAKQYWQQVMSEYPNSSASKLAANRMK